jgi:serine/threonine protein phosphatase PrpC
MKINTYTITNNRDGVNKDRFLIKNNWFTIADGVSSKGEAGALAAQIVIDEINKINLEEIKSNKDIKNLLNEINLQIRLINGATTCTSIILKNNKLILFHCGDSECYILSDCNFFSEITRPDTLAYANLNNGLNLKDIKHIPHMSNVLLQCLNGKDFIPQIRQFDLNHIKAIFLCSDGANIVPIEEIGTMLVSEENPAEIIAKKALQLESNDDITCISIIL